MSVKKAAARVGGRRGKNKKAKKDKKAKKKAKKAKKDAKKDAKKAAGPGGKCGSMLSGCRADCDKVWVYVTRQWSLTSLAAGAHQQGKDDEDAHEGSAGQWARPVLMPIRSELSSPQRGGRGGKKKNKKNKKLQAVPTCPPGATCILPVGKPKTLADILSSFRETSVQISGKVGPMQQQLIDTLEVSDRRALSHVNSI